LARNPHYFEDMVRLVLSLLGTLMLTCAAESSTDNLAKGLEPLRPLLKTWKGEFVGGKSPKPMVDVVRFERAMNGQAIRALHSVNDGMYAGETLIVWDEGAKEIQTFYFTTTGDRTEGLMKVESEGVINSTETVKGAEGKTGAVTKVRATSKLLADGRLHVKSEYWKDGSWAPGHEVLYKEDSAAVVVFK
jgi:hypothetical protein